MSKEEILEKLESNVKTLRVMAKECDDISNIETFNKPADNIYSSKSIRSNMYHACRELHVAVRAIELAIDTIKTGMIHG